MNMYREGSNYTGNLIDRTIESLAGKLAASDKYTR